MNSKPLRLVLLLMLVHVHSFSQKLKKADRTIVSNLQAHINTLSGANMEGRRSGTSGEKLAAEYIGKQFARYGLKPKGDGNSWSQHFEIYDGKEIMPSSKLSINGHSLKLYTEYFPFAFSANKNAEAAVAIALAENGVPWFKDIRELIGDEDSAKIDTLELIRVKAHHAAEKGATALIIYNSSKKNDLEFDKYPRAAAAGIPVVYIRKGAFKKYCSDESAILDVSLNVAMEERKRTGNNIVGYADNGADSTVLTIAHLDKETDVAAIIEMTRLLRVKQQKAKNFLFVVYAAERHGALGRDYFTRHPSVNLSNIHYALALDTVALPDQRPPAGLRLVKRSVEIIKNN